MSDINDLIYIIDMVDEFRKHQKSYSTKTFNGTQSTIVKKTNYENK